MIKMKVSKIIGKRTYDFEVEGKDFHEVVLKSNNLSFDDVSHCGLCSSVDLELDAYIAQKKFKYVKVKCRNCRASVAFGNKIEEPDTFYLRKVMYSDGVRRLDWQSYKNTNQ